MLNIIHTTASILEFEFKPAKSVAISISPRHQSNPTQPLKLNTKYLHKD